MLALRQYPIDYLIKALAAEVQLYTFKVVRRTVANMMVKAEVLLVVPKVKGLATHMAHLCWISHILQYCIKTICCRCVFLTGAVFKCTFAHRLMHTSQSAEFGHPAEFFLPPNGQTATPTCPCFPSEASGPGYSISPAL